jgi:hypothetical protein
MDEHEIKNTITKVAHTIKKKVGLTGDLIGSLEDRVESLDDTIRQCREIVSSLQRAHRSKWAILNVCERRLELRKERPLEELTKDSCQERLEQERTTLIEARQELSGMVDAMKERLLVLDRTRALLLEDLQHKRHGLRIDRSCLPSCRKKTGSSGATSARGGALAELPALSDQGHGGTPPAASPQRPVSSPSQGSSPGHRLELNRQQETKQLLAHAHKVEEESMRVMNAGDAVMLHTKYECDEATGRIGPELSRRVGETAALKQRLEKQVRDTEDTIVQVENTLQHTKERILLHDRPMRALDERLHARSFRTKREHIRDTVHEEMEEEWKSLKKSAQCQGKKFEATREVLEQLMASKKQLLEDIRLKAASLKIDDACLRVTPQKAIELDRMDPRGGRRRQPPGGGEHMAIDPNRSSMSSTRATPLGSR